MQYWHNRLVPVATEGSSRFDFGEAVTVTAACLAYHINESIGKFSIFTGTVDWSDDGISWTTASSTFAWTMNPFGWLRAVETISESAHRYWRVEVPEATDFLSDVFFYGSGPVTSLPCPLTSAFKPAGIPTGLNRTEIRNELIEKYPLSFILVDGDYSIETMFIRAAEGGILLDLEEASTLQVYTAGIPLIAGAEPFVRKYGGINDEFSGTLTLMVEDGNARNIVMKAQSGQSILTQDGSTILLFGDNKPSQLLTQSGDIIATVEGETLLIF